MIKISSFELENVKRVHHVQVEPRPEGLTVIGGKNAQGKTSVLDAIAWTLGGDKYKPQSANNADAVTPPKLKVELSNGLVVERRGKNGALYVTDPTGAKAGQTLLDSFIDKLAIDLPKFMEQSDKEKATTLLQIIGVEAELNRLQTEEDRLANERLLCGREADRKKHYAEELGPYEENVPADPISAAELIQQQQEILLQNAKNREARAKVHDLENFLLNKQEKIKMLRGQLERLEIELKETEASAKETADRLEKAQKTTLDLKDESTEAIEENLRNIEEINKKVAFNKTKAKADDDANKAVAEYEAFNEKIKAVRTEKLKLLNGADLPLPELSVENNALTYKGHPWKAMSGAEQLKVAVAIVRRLKPECGFVLMDKLEQFDLDTLEEFGAWLEGEGLQVIATRVSTGEECQIIIEDGFVKEDNKPEEPAPSWSAGTF